MTSTSFCSTRTTTTSSSRCCIKWPPPSWPPMTSPGRYAGSFATTRQLRSGIRASHRSTRTLARSPRRWDRDITGDYLVLAPGAQANFFGTPGAAEHSLPLYSVNDAERLRGRILEVLDATIERPELIEKGALELRDRWRRPHRRRNGRRARRGSQRRGPGEISSRSRSRPRSILSIMGCAAGTVLGQGACLCRETIGG